MERSAFRLRLAFCPGASVFWIRPAMLLLGESLDSFISRWQLKRDGGRRGILEVVL